MVYSAPAGRSDGWEHTGTWCFRAVKTNSEHSAVTWFA